MTIFILHGITGRAGIHWQQWLADELSNLGHKVLMPTLPNPDHPDRQESLKFVVEQLKNFDPNELVLVGHSLGVTTLLDYLEIQKAQALVSVSGFFEDYGAELNSYFLKEKTVDLSKVKQNCSQFFVLYGDNDPYVPQEKLKNLSEGLGVAPEIFPVGGHLNSETGYTAFPRLLEIVGSI